MSARRRSAFDWSTAVIAALVLAAAAKVWLQGGSARMLEVLSADLGLFADILPKVFAGCLIGAFVTQLLPREMVARWVGAESGFAGILVATMAGAILPGGPFTIYPVAGAFLAIGADAGAAIAFITSWTLLGYNRALVWEMPFFGYDFVFWRVLVALPFPVLAGVLARLAVRAISARLIDP
ncbi:MAG: permease [Rhizobiales bacterium]|nr:permease [Hyphomicrobiales bacterium]